MKPFTLSIPLLLVAAVARGGDDWPQLQGNALRSGNAAAATVKTPLGLVGAVPLSDGIYAAPVIADGKVFVIDGSGVVVAIDAQTLQVLWRFATRGGPGNCNNVAAPAVIGKQCLFELSNAAGATLRVQLLGYDTADVETLARAVWSVQ